VILTVAVGVVGLVSPDYGTTIRRAYFAAPTSFYTAGALRILMGLVVIAAAGDSRMPRMLRLLGAVMCLQGVTATVLGPEHARTVLEFETRQGHAVLRLGAAVALAAGIFMAFALSGRSVNRSASA
jgi:hypothetical protein